jgi:hypothetical protein
MNSIGWGVRLFNGIALGIEHEEGFYEEGINWVILIDILCIRFMIFSVNEKIHD